MSPHLFTSFLYPCIFTCLVSAQYDSTKSYELQVPGSHPIRIIEAQETPLWGAPRRRSSYTTETSRTDLEHRGIYSAVKRDSERPQPYNAHVELSLPFSKDYHVDYEEDAETSTENTAGKLSEFLKKYAHIRKRPENDRGPDNDGGPEHFDKVELITKGPYRGNSDEKEDVAEQDKSKSWNLMDVRRHQYPYEDKKGWVSMDAIPWSVSQVAKWQSKIQQINKYDENRDSDRDSDYDRIWNQKPEEHRPYSEDIRIKPASQPYTSKNPHYSNKRHSVKPISTITHAHKIYLENRPEVSEEEQRRPWLNTKQDNCDDHTSPEIIMDHRAPNFPGSSTKHGHHRRQGSMGDEAHPITHPFNGAGEWVLLSTTKGFKYPKSRRRSLQIETEPTAANTPDSIATHKSVRLTVLPPLKNSKVNMTTSHGGLLQVESTFQSVDDAQKLHAKQKYKRRPHNNNNNNNNRPAKRPTKLVALNQVQQSVTTTPQTHSGPDASGVLAAVGAGMIPATMAMLVPLAMSGRRRRKRHTLHLPTSLPTFDEIQIQLPHFN